MRIPESTIASFALLVSLGFAGCGQLDGGGNGGGDEEQTYDNHPHFLGSCRINDDDGDRLSCDSWKRAITEEGLEEDLEFVESSCEGSQGGVWTPDEDCPVSGSYVGTCVEKSKYDELRSDRYYYSAGHGDNIDMFKEECKQDNQTTWVER